ncbi:MAG: GLPGLI family protein [Cytophagales bacterium]|nr:GLPGLI family protein [Cytophagales bacterium]
MKVNKIIVSILALNFQLLVVGQGNIMVIYEETDRVFDLRNYENLESMPLSYASVERINREKRSEKTIYSLQFDGDNSLFKFESKEVPWLKNSSSEFVKDHYEHGNNKKGYPSYFKDLNNHSLRIYGGSLPKHYVVEDDLNEINQWELLPMDSVISGFSCKAAKYKKAKHVMAWYTVDIPIADGPKHYSGLPGLIVAIKQEDGRLLMISRIEKSHSNNIQEAPINSSKKINFKKWKNQFLRLPTY